MGLKKLISKIFSINSEWELLESDKFGEDTAPRWVIKALNKYIGSFAVRPYNATKYFKGRTFIYKVYFKWAGTGTIEPIIWRKLKHKKEENYPKHKRNKNTSSLIDYCKSCHRKRMFKENSQGHFYCVKCGWRNPCDW